MKNKGFTLIELAIVIIVIAIITAAISAGGKLIDQAKLKQYIADNQVVAVAYNEFLVRYSEVPGDLTNGANLFPTACQTATDCNGNGDGQVDFNPTEATDETGTAFRFLNLAELITKGGEIQLSTTYDPQNVIGQELYYYQSFNGGGLVIAGASTAYGNYICENTAGVIGQGELQHMFLAENKNAIYLIKDGANSCRGAMDANKAYQIDKKIDDASTAGGVAIGANTGKFRVTNDKAAANFCVTGNTYNLTQTNETCIPAQMLTIN